jgi:Secretion system C-terminal sorting domain/Pregnancy-associated plasma protein-A
MKYFYILSIVALLSDVAAAQRCGEDVYIKSLKAADTSFARRFDQLRDNYESVAAHYKAHPEELGARTSSIIYPVPVIFHIVVDSAKFLELGGNAGIQQRVDSQIVVLNRDFLAQNPDSVAICSCFKPLFTNTNIRFASATVDPSGGSTPGYDVTIVPTGSTGFCCLGDSYAQVKYDSTGGANAWDVTKYVNVWCTFFQDDGGLLGVTVSHALLGTKPANQIGICALYNALGSRASTSDSYPGGGTEFDEGRTVVHEMGHVFEIWHPWGDDGGLCPWQSGGRDDGIADTPPQRDYVYGGISTCGYHDACDTDGCGLILSDYMQYSDDSVMHLFTKDQALVMESNVLASSGESFSLTQHPELTTPTAINSLVANTSVDIFPNPTTGILNIAPHSATDKLLEVTVYNTLGQAFVHGTITKPTNNYAINLSSFPKGIYLVRCNFVSGSITRKITLQ